MERPTVVGGMLMGEPGTRSMHVPRLPWFVVIAVPGRVSSQTGVPDGQSPASFGTKLAILHVVVWG